MTADYRDRVMQLLADGSRFAGLHATAGGAQVRLAFTASDGAIQLESVAPREGQVPSIVDLAPAADWDEREAADLYGIRFDGHEPLRPLVDHDLDLARWTVPVHGDDPYQIAVGPIHAGVIESGHFRFHVVGDRILHVDARLFYKHRGLERAAEGQTLDAGLPYAMRACAACAVSNSVAYAHACEEALGLRPTADLARVRTLLLELERTWNHLNDISAVCSGVGLAAGATSFAALIEQMRRLNATITGHRFGFGSIQVGGSALQVDAATVDAARAEISTVAAAARRSWRELLFNSSFQDRLPDIGVVTRTEAHALGAVGPSARASGVTDDVRVTSDRLLYDGFTPSTLAHPTGDARARLEQRALELDVCFDLLDALLAGAIAPSGAERSATERAIGVGRVESPRGATLCIVERAGSHLERLRLRTGSYANWPIVAHAAVGDLLPDFPLINKSFELCYACVDR